MKTFSYVVGTVLLLVGFLGFFNNPVLGLFEVDTAHNLVHVVTGIAVLALASSSASRLRSGLMVIGVAYALITVLGFIMGEGELLGIVHVNGADNWLHLALTVLFLGMGFATPKRGEGRVAY